MVSDSGFCNIVSSVDNRLTNGSDPIVPDTGTSVSAVVPSSAENSATEKSATEKSATVKSVMEIPTPENFNPEKSSAEKTTVVKSTPENFTAEKSATDYSFTTKFTAENSIAENLSTENLSTENSTAEKSATEKSFTEKCITVEFTPENSAAEPSAMRTDPVLFDFRKLPRELCNKILEYAFHQQSPLTNTLEPPTVSQASKFLRHTALSMYYHERELSIQVPYYEDTRDNVEALQDELMERWNHPPYPGHAKRVKEMLEEEANEVEVKVDECLEDLETMESISVYYSYVKTIRVWSGRFRINRTGFTYNWAPRSCIVGFKAFSEPRVPGQIRRAFRRINADGTLDWTDFGLVRRAYAVKLRQVDSDFQSLAFSDVLLHPAVQYIVKELCLLGAAGAPAMEWVEVMVDEWSDGSTRRELGMPDYQPDDVDDLSPLPSAAGSPLPSDNEWDDEDEEEEPEEEEPEEDSEHESEHWYEHESEHWYEHESEHEANEDEPAGAVDGDVSQDQVIG